MRRWVLGVVVTLLVVAVANAAHAAEEGGICCLPDGCHILLEIDCEEAGGVYLGDTGLCSDTTCDGVPTTPRRALLILALALLGTGAAHLTRRRLAT